MDAIAQVLALALQEIARGVQCKRPLPGGVAQAVAKEALVSVGLDWIARNPFVFKPPTDEGLAAFRARAAQGRASVLA